MAIGRDTTAANIKPLEGAIVRRVQIGATVSAGELITLQSDGKWDPTDTSAAQLTVAVAIQAGVDTDYIDAVHYGPVKNITGGTPGAKVYGSDTGGELAESAGTKSTIVGFVESATILFVQPQIVDLT